MIITRRLVLAGGSALMAGPGWALARNGPIVTCEAGQYEGEWQDGVAVFRGIRYGRADRFRAPRPVARGANLVSAREFGPDCPQPLRKRPQSEDCLFLNIWTPGIEATARKPVMVYIHGGAFAFGSGADPQTDGQILASRGDVVVVTLNHRLNAFGYLYLAGLDPRFPDSGNAGQLDILLALRWVKANIARFGGDPDRVMLFGQSGGGGKITNLMAAPAAKGLFSRVATMSGQQVTASGPIRAAARTEAFARKLKVAPTELPVLPAERLLEGLAAEDPAYGGPVHMGPVLDGRWISRHPFWPDAPSISHDVNMMMGGTRDETRNYFSPDSPMIRQMNWDNVGAQIAGELPVDVPPELVVATYRRHMPEASPSDIFFAATTDGRSWRGQLEILEARAKAGRPVFAYQVNFSSRADPRRGAEHAIDVPLVFGTLSAKGSPTGDAPDAREASVRMQDCFLAFARTGDPNCRAIPHWPRYTLKDRPTMMFDIKARLERDPRRWQRLLFAPAPYTQPGT
ncbi:MAG: carboxylesterase/lipase family protein [Sphingosinicella sp.]|nr:carboxylesterase/lipase family protein [Sphingosinicella sp.]